MRANMSNHADHQPTAQEIIEARAELHKARKAYFDICDEAKEAFYTKAHLDEAYSYLKLVTDKASEVRDELKNASAKVDTIKADLKAQDGLQARESASWDQLMMAVENAYELGIIEVKNQKLLEPPK